MLVGRPPEAQQPGQERRRGALKHDRTGTAHHMRTGEDRGDYFYVLTKDGSDPTFGQFAAGIAIDLR